MTKIDDLSVEDIIKYFITAFDTSDTILTHHCKRQQAEQPQSIFLRPVTDVEVMQHISTFKNKESVGRDSIEVAVLKKAFQLVFPYSKTAFKNVYMQACFFKV